MATIDRRGAVVSATDPAQASDPNPGLAVKTAVAAATTGTPITLNALQTIDGYTTGEGDRVLVKDQADATTNGIYNAASGNWQRATDADESTDFAPGLQVYCIGGTLNAGKTFKLVSASPIVLGLTALTWQVITFPSSALEWQFGPGNGAAVQPGQGPSLEVPFDCQIVRARLVADMAGAIVIDLWNTPFGIVPGAANSICAADKPTLTAAQFFNDTALTGWSVQLAAGSWITPNVESANLVRLVTLSLTLSRSN